MMVREHFPQMQYPPVGASQRRELRQREVLAAAWV